MDKYHYQVICTQVTEYFQQGNDIAVKRLQAWAERTSFEL
jgi:hypothetical protein